MFFIKLLFVNSVLINYSNQSDSTLLYHFEDKNYQKVIEIVSEGGFSNTAENLSLAGKSYYFLKNYGDAIKTLSKSLAIQTNQNQFYDSYTTTYYISTSFLRLRQTDSAVYYREKGLEFAELSKNEEAVSRAMNNLAVLYRKQTKYKDALLLFQKAAQIDKNDSTYYMKMRCNIADVYHRIGILDSALQIVSSTYKYFKSKKEESYWRWLTTYRLAYIERDYRNELAPSYFKELIEMSDNDYDKGLALVGLGQSYLLKENDSCLYFLSRAEEIESTNLVLKREINFLKARIFLNFEYDLQKLEESIFTLDSAQLIEKDERGEALFRIFESKYFLELEQEANSLKSISIAIENSRKVGLKDRLSQALTQKFKVLNHFGRYKEALEVKEEEIKVREELFNDRSEAVYQILRTQNEMDKQESTIANQQLEIDNNNLQILIMYISIALVVSAMVFIFWQYRTRSKYAQKLETMFLDSRHRYMNNLLLLKNWFNEGKTDKNDEIISFAQNRIDAISTVNRHLDRLSYNKDTIESKSFLEDISHNLLANREFTSEIENVPINMSVSGPLGMITNEIITNGLKYGEAPYAIRFHKNGGGYLLEIEDHGPGIADPEKQGTGSKVLRLLSRQLKGKLIYQNKADHSPDARGTLVSLNFKG